MSRQCDHSHEHCHLEGSIPGWSVKRTVFLENFQPTMAAVLATAIATPEDGHQWYHGYVVNETPVPEGSKQTTLTPTSKAEAHRLVQRLHRNLGHATPKALCELLAEGQIRRSWTAQPRINAQRAIDTGSRTRWLLQRWLRVESSTFNQLVQADIMWIKNLSKKYTPSSPSSKRPQNIRLLRFSTERKLSI